MSRQLLKKVIKHAKAKAFIYKHEKTFSKEVRYMYIDKGSEDLLIVFSGFTGENRRYNYFTSFKNIEINQLYILDTWGILGSYYWYEKHDNRPESLVNSLIENIVVNNNIKRIFTAGTSKGGTAAIYFGILHNAVNVFSGACQYYVGSYLGRPEQKNILIGMMGADNEELSIKLLDSKMPELLEKYSASCSSIIELFYSTKELTYERQIIPLKKALDKYGYIYVETIEDFEDHNDVGKFFPAFLLSKMGLILKESDND